MENNFENYQDNDFKKPQQPLPNGLASASLILGIISICLSCCFYLSVPLAALSILFALLSKGDNPKMEGRASTGIILSVIAIAACIVMLIGLIVSGTFMETWHYMQYYPYHSGISF